MPFSQEAIDRSEKIKQKEDELQRLIRENRRLRDAEENVEKIQDELERVRHSAHVEKNNLLSSLANAEEQNRHLKSKLQVIKRTTWYSIRAITQRLV